MSFRGYKRSIILDFNSSAVTRGTADVNRQMALLNSEFRKSQAEVGKAGSSFDKLALTQDRLTHASKLQADKVNILKKELENLTKSEGDNQKAIDRKTIELRKAETQYIKTGDQLKNVTKELEEQNKELGTIKGKWGELLTQTRNANPDFDKTVGTLKKTTAAVVGIGTGAALASMSFDKEFAKILAIFDTTKVSSVELRDGILDLSKSANIGSGELASAMAIIASSNIDAADSLGLLTDAAELARAGNSDVASTVSVLTGMINSYGLEVDKSRELSDKLIVTQKLGNLSLDELGDGFGKVTALSATANIPLEEMLAAMATLTTNGMSTSEAMTVLRGILNGIVKPSGEAAQKAKELGINFSLAGLKSKGFAGFLDDVKRKARGSEQTITELYGSQTAMTGALILGSNGADLFAKSLKDITGASGETSEALEKVKDNTGERMSSAMNKMAVSAIRIGEALSPIVEVIAFLIEKVAGFNEHVLIGIGITAIFFPLLKVGSALLIGLASSSTIAAGALGMFGVAGAISGGQILLVAAAIGLVVGLLAALVGNTRKAKKEIAEIGAVAQGSVNNVMNSTQQQVKSASQKAYAIGTNYASGGMALVGEHGPELMHVPRGSKIHDAGTTSHMEQQESRKVQQQIAMTDAKLDAVVGRLDRILDSVDKHPSRMQAIDRMGIARA